MSGPGTPAGAGCTTEKSPYTTKTFYLHGYDAGQWVASADRRLPQPGTRAQARLGDLRPRGLPRRPLRAVGADVAGVVARHLRRGLVRDPRWLGEGGTQLRRPVAARRALREPVRVHDLQALRPAAAHVHRGCVRRTDLRCDEGARPALPQRVRPEHPRLRDVQRELHAHLHAGERRAAAAHGSPVGRGATTPSRCLPAPTARRRRTRRVKPAMRSESGAMLPPWLQTQEPTTLPKYQAETATTETNSDASESERLRCG